MQDYKCAALQSGKRVQQHLMTCRNTRRAWRHRTSRQVLLILPSLLSLIQISSKMASAARPVRAALIGLSSSGNSSWASAAHLPALLTETGRSKITITALSNSSVHAAKSAIQKYGLPEHTKAYGSPEDLAADPDIDLIICNTRVDKHYETILPSIKAGKDVYVEWPIASNREQIDDIIEAARKSESRVAVGLQRRWTPPAAKLREILDSGNGRLGKVLSSDVRAFGGTNDREVLPTGLKYFSQKEIGGNAIVIGVGHGGHHVPQY